MNISRRLSSCLIFATVFARAWIFCAALACLGCGRPTSPGAGGGERGGCPGRSTRGPAGEHCAGLLAGGPLGRPVRNATADDSMSSTPLIAARPRRAVPRAILFGMKLSRPPFGPEGVFTVCVRSRLQFHAFHVPHARTPSSLVSVSGSLPRAVGDRLCIAAPARAFIGLLAAGQRRAREGLGLMQLCACLCPICVYIY